jgi:ethanolamine ammonia-lyase large subunit
MIRVNFAIWRPQLTAAVSKLMRKQDLIMIARKCRVVTRFRGTIGLPGRIATRLQPNHLADDPRCVAAATLGGLALGANAPEVMGGGAPVDLVFQSVSRGEAANMGFGVDLSLFGEACAAAPR